MQIKSIVLSLLIGLVLTPQVNAQVTVISGEQIKPENGNQQKTTQKTTQKSTNPQTVRKKSTKTVRVIKGDADKDLTVVALQSINTGVSKVGEEVYFEAAESEGGIVKGTLLKGKVASFGESKKNRFIEIKLQEAWLGGRSLVLDGKIKAMPTAKGSQLSLLVGEKFTAKLTPGSMKKGGAGLEPRAKIKKGKLLKEPVFAEITGNGLEANLAKGKAKGDLLVLIEAPKGQDLKIFKKDTPISIIKVNEQTLPQEIVSSNKVKTGDRNGNGVADMRFSFPAWQTLKYLPRGASKITLQGDLANGGVFLTTATIKAHY